MQDKSKHPLVTFLLDRFRITIMLVGFLIVWGVISYMNLPRESEPEIVIPIGLVMTVFPGASPQDVEELVTDKIEERLESLSDIKKITSSSSLGVSTIVVEFEAEADLDKSIQDLKDEVEKAKIKLPEEAEDPFVTALDITDNAILRFSLSSDMSERELQKWADRLAAEIETLPNVKEVLISGKRDLEWQVNIDPAKLEFYKIPFNQVMMVIGSNNINVPAGNLDIDERLYNVRVNQKITSIDDLKRLPLAAREQGFIYLEDVAEIKETLSAVQSKASLYLTSDPEIKPALTLNVKKRVGGNIIKVSEGVLKHIDKLKEQNLIPDNLVIEVVWDQAFWVKDSLNILQRSAIQTMILILIILFLVLTMRAALITSFIIPLSFLTTFGLLSYFNITLNGMTLFSLVLALGLLVDTAIVIMEGMYEGLKLKMSPREAAFYSLKTFKWSVISGVATTIAAFIPMLLVSGIMGQYLRTIPITVSILLGSSLFWSLTLLPVFGAKFLESSSEIELPKNKLIARFRNGRDAFLERVYNAYGRMMTGILAKKAKRRLVMGLAWLAFFIVVAFPIVGILKVGLFPTIDMDSIFVNVKVARGTTLDGTEQVVRRIEEHIIDLPELDSFVTTIGSNISLSGMGGGSGEHLAYISIQLKKDRDRKSFEIINELRPRLKGITEAEVTIEDISGGPPSGAPIEARITGPDLDKLQKLAGEVEELLAAIPGTVDVSSDLEPGLPEFVFKLKREKLAYYGLSAGQVAGFLRTLVYGTTVSSVSIDGEDIDIILKTDQAIAGDISQIRQINILTAVGPVSLGDLADIDLQPSLALVSHEDGERIARVRSFVKKDESSVADITKEFEAQIKDFPLDAGYRISLGGELEDISQSFIELYIAMSVAIFLIFMILVLQFNSFRQTLIILFSLPLAFIGVVIGLTIMRVQLDFPAFIGVVGLAGIAVNDAIILISQINRNLYYDGNPERGVKVDDVVDQIVQAGTLRIQPIFLTTITTILGILPVTFADETWRSLGFAIIWGLAFATILTLIIIPVMYVNLQKKRLGIRA